MHYIVSLSTTWVCSVQAIAQEQEAFQEGMQSGGGLSVDSTVASSIQPGQIIPMKNFSWDLPDGACPVSYTHLTLPTTPYV